MTKIKPIDWLKSHLPKINDKPVIELQEINDGDEGFEDAQKITKGDLYTTDLVSGEYNEDTDELYEHEFEVALPLFVIRRNSDKPNPYKPNFIFSAIDEDETEEEFIELAKKELAENDLEEFRKTYKNY